MSAASLLPLTICAGLLLGKMARGTWRRESGPFIDRLVLDVATGLGLLSLVFFALASFNLLIGDFPKQLFGLAAAGGFWLLLADVVFHVAEWKREKRLLPSWRSVLWVLAFICLALYLLIPAMAPPSASDWDSLAYHLSVPKLFLEHGGFYYIDWMSHSNFPMLVEMLYLPALSVDSPAGAKMVHYLYGVLLVLAVVMLVRKHFPSPQPSPRSDSISAGNARAQRGEGAARLAALAVAGIPIVMWEATTAYIDLATALYTVVAVYLLLDYLDKPELKTLVWCGVAAGFAASTKMTALALIPMLAVWLVVDGVRQRNRRTITQVVKHALLLAGVGLLVCSPWYIKSLVYTGNPVYPFFHSIFGGKDWTAELAQNYAALQAKFGVGHDFASFALLPVDVTFRSEMFYDTPGLYVGPILLVAIPLLLVARNWTRKLKGLAWFFAAQMVIWFALTQQSRYLIPAFAILAVIIAAVAYSDERLRVTRAVLHVVFGTTALFGALVMLPIVRQTAPVACGRETADQYLTRTLSIYGAERWINENTPSRAKVALFGDTRGFYLNRDYVWADWGHNARFTRKFDSVEGFISYMKEQKISYALVNAAVMPEPSKATGTAHWVYEAIAQGRLLPVGDTGRASVGVFRIK